MTVALRPPGDKSLSHRCLMLAPLARGESRIRGLLVSRDVAATAAAMRALGAEIPDLDAEEMAVPGPAEFRDPPEPIDCDNSGTTARLLSGVIAGLGRAAVVDGDASLRRRPMDRVVYPLQAMGAKIRYVEDAGRLPIEFASRATGSLRRLRHRPRIASAQVKSCLLLAGLISGVRVEVIEPGRSRDHTERLLAAMGAPITFGPDEETAGARAVLEPVGRRLARGGAGTESDLELAPLDLRVPGDLSSAAFLLAASVLGSRPVRLEGVGLNPTRTGFLEILALMGTDLERENAGSEAGEPVGDLRVSPSEIRAFEIGPDLVPRVLDEIPLLAVLAARARGRSRVRGAGELRVKESDRLALLVENLEAIGVRVDEREDGFEIEGGQRPLEGEVRTMSDHRIAMAFGVLARLPGSEIAIDDPTCVAVSYPSFWEDLERVLP